MPPKLPHTGQFGSRPRSASVGTVQDQLKESRGDHTAAVAANKTLGDQLFSQRASLESEYFVKLKEHMRIILNVSNEFIECINGEMESMEMQLTSARGDADELFEELESSRGELRTAGNKICLLYTSPSPRD